MIPLLLNSPYSLIGVFLALLLRPRQMSFGRNPYHVVFRVRSVWSGFGYMRGWTGATIGNVVIINPREGERLLEHELVHVLQFQKYPLIFPILYYVELLRHGYRENKYEKEAYTIAGNKRVIG